MKINFTLSFCNPIQDILSGNNCNKDDKYLGPLKIYKPKSQSCFINFLLYSLILKYVNGNGKPSSSILNHKSTQNSSSAFPWIAALALKDLNCLFRLEAIHIQLLFNSKNGENCLFTLVQTDTNMPKKIQGNTVCSLRENIGKMLHDIINEILKSHHLNIKCLRCNMSDYFMTQKQDTREHDFTKDEIIIKKIQYLWMNKTCI